jgi:hypothetical protein
VILEISWLFHLEHARSMQDPASEFPRIYLLGSSVNKGRGRVEAFGQRKSRGSLCRPRLFFCEPQLRLRPRPGQSSRGAK